MRIKHEMSMNELKLIDANTKLVDEIKLLKRDVKVLERRINKTLEYLDTEGQIDKKVLIALLTESKYKEIEDEE